MGIGDWETRSEMEAGEFTLQINKSRRDAMSVTKKNLAIILVP
jgi:hypothetical protein